MLFAITQKVLECLLIAPEGIEIIYRNTSYGGDGGLLIAPEGIEIKNSLKKLFAGLKLLIAPEGIEILQMNQNEKIMALS